MPRLALLPTLALSLSQLLPGVYQLQAEAAGFKAFQQNKITLIAGQSAALNVAMQIGDFSRRVEMAAESVTITICREGNDVMNSG